MLVNRRQQRHFREPRLARALAEQFFSQFARPVGVQHVAQVSNSFKHADVRFRRHSDDHFTRLNPRFAKTHSTLLRPPPAGGSA